MTATTRNESDSVFHPPAERLKRYVILRGRRVLRYYVSKKRALMTAKRMALKNLNQMYYVAEITDYAIGSE